MGAFRKVNLLTLYTLLFVSTVYAENNEESTVNKIEDNSPDSAQRSARYINSKPYYPNSGGGYYDRYPNQYPGGTSFYPDRPVYPNKLDPNYWLSKIPGFPSTSYPQGGYYPGSYNPGGYYPGGTNFIGYNPQGGRYPNYYPNSGGYYPGSSGGYYPGSGGYYPGYGGYGGYQGNGGFSSYNGYDGYYSQGNKPGNIGFGYQNGRRNGVIATAPGYPATYTPIATPATVSKDAK